MSSISYYFGGKEDLYRECFREHGTNFMNLISGILSPPRDKADFEAKMRLVLQQLYHFTAENRDMILMITKDILQTNLAGKKNHEIFLKIPQLLHEFFNEAKKLRIIRDDVDVEILTDIMTSPGFKQMLFVDFKEEGRNMCFLDLKYRKDLADQIFEILIKGIY